MWKGLGNIQIVSVSSLPLQFFLLLNVFVFYIFKLQIIKKQIKTARIKILFLHQKIIIQTCELKCEIIRKRHTLDGFILPNL